MILGMVLAERVCNRSGVHEERSLCWALRLYERLSLVVGGGVGTHA